MNRTAAIRTLTRLLDEKSAIKGRGPKDAAFQKWYRAASNALCDAFGVDSSYVADLAAIKFQIEPELIVRVKRTARKIIQRDEEKNLVRIHAVPLSLTRAEAKHFEQAIDRAAEILLSGKIELTTRVQK